jgi:hypothetical protein
MPNVVESYDDVIRLLEDDFRIVCFEQVGFGFSFPKDGFRFARRSYVDATVEMLHALDLGPYSLVPVRECVHRVLGCPRASGVREPPGLDGGDPVT